MNHGNYDVEPDQKINWQIIKIIWPYLMEYRSRVLLALGCLIIGGVLSGEHGIGVEKRDLMPCMFNDADLDAQERIKASFDPAGILNPGKILPSEVPPPVAAGSVA